MTSKRLKTVMEAEVKTSSQIFLSSFKLPGGVDTTNTGIKYLVIAQGAGPGQRVGRRIRTLSYHYRGTVFARVQPRAAFTDVYHNGFEIILVHAKSRYLGTTDITDILGKADDTGASATATFLGVGTPPNPAGKDNFEILFRKYYDATPPSMPANTGFINQWFTQWDEKIR